MRLIDADALIQTLVTNGWLKMDFLKDSADMIAIQAAIDAAPTITPPPNSPLTLEELRELDGEPVWLVGEGLDLYDIFCGEATDHIAQFYKEALPAWAYGRTWRAYRRKPEEGKQEL